MKKSILILVGVVLGFVSNGALYAAGVTRERALADFTGISLKDVGFVKIHFSPNYKVAVTTDSDSLQGFLTTEVRGSILYVGINKSYPAGTRSNELTVDVFMPTLKKINVSGAGSVYVDKGKLPSLDIFLSGVGTIDAQECEVEDVKVDANGLGQVKIWAAKRLEISKSGFAEIDYKGKPEVIEKDLQIFKSNGHGAFGVTVDNSEKDYPVFKPNGPVVTRERIVDSFTGISPRVGEVRLHFSTNYKVTVTTDDYVQDIITAATHNNVLYIDVRKNRGGITPTMLIIDVYMPDIKKLSIEGAANVYIDKGNLPSLDISVSGNGNISAQNCQVENITVNLSGEGQIYVWATKYLHMVHSGIGKIQYKGKPEKVVREFGVGKTDKWSRWVENHETEDSMIRY